MADNKISKTVQKTWKMESYTGMYAEMVQETGISRRTLSLAINHAVGNPETEAAITKFFADKKIHA